MDFIRRFFIEHGCSPSFSEIGSALGMSAQHVGRIVRELTADGLIGFTPGEPRSITIPEIMNDLATDQILLELLRRGWVVNPEKILEAPGEVANCGVHRNGNLLHGDAAVGGVAGDGQGDQGIEENPADDAGAAAGKATG